MQQIPLAQERWQWGEKSKADELATIWNSNWSWRAGIGLVGAQKCRCLLMPAITGATKILMALWWETVNRKRP